MFVAALRNEELGILHLEVKRKGDNDFFGRAVEAFTDLRNGFIQEFFIGFIEFPLVFVREALVDCTVLYMNIIDEGILPCVIIYNREYIDICNRMAYDFTFCCEIIESHVTLFAQFCFLESQFFSIFLHLLFEHVLYLARVSFQYFPGLSYRFLIVFITLFVDARRSAVMQMVFQAGLVFSLFYAFFRDGETAGSWFIHLFYYVKNGVHTADMAVRAVESAVTLVDVSCLEDTGKVFVRYTDTGISLPVFEQYVVFRLVLFD